MEKRNWIHLYNRMAFGASEMDLEKLSSRSAPDILENLTQAYEEINVAKLKALKDKANSKENRRELQKLAREYMANLNVSWLNKMIKSDTPVLEKINLFWHHHFACEIKNPVFAVSFSNMIRENALGNFRALLKGVSSSAAMISYLNLNKNKKASPNEDFARELCELFTLGLDKEYSERDISEIARAFTGWNHSPLGNFKLRKKLHDNGRKTIFGKEGDFDGDDVIDLILEKKECAVFIAENVYAFFVNPIPNHKQIAEIAEVLFDSDYDLKAMFAHIISSSWFYDEENIMVKIKSPIELLVGLGRQFKIESPDERPWITYQRAMDQILYRPPNVAGWKVNQEWINSNSLSLRLRLSSIILADGFIDLDLKPELDEMAMKKRKAKKGMQLLKGFLVDWDYFFRNNPNGNFETIFFNDKISVQALKALAKEKSENPREKVLQLLSLPEYQLS